ncbi:MAG: DNA-3-methyladenine glycosylase [Candidatus Dojkabacteria bacterium]
MKTLLRPFYNRSALLVAPELLGKVLVHKFDGQTITGRIVEVEAYLADQDEAAHSFKGETKRTKSLFTKPGVAYLYSIHQQVCFDVVCNVPTSVLIRALDPIEGIEFMKTARVKENLKDLTSGPGKLTKALGITKSLDGIDLTSEDSELFLIDDGFKLDETLILKNKRIGISKAKNFDYRFFIESQYLSRKN